MSNSDFTPSLDSFYDWCETNYKFSRFTEISTRSIFCILGEFLFRCPLTNNLNEFIFRTSTIFMTYAPVLIGFEMDIAKQINLVKQLQLQVTEKKQINNQSIGSNNTETTQTTNNTQSFAPAEDELTSTANITTNSNDGYGSTITNTNIATAENRNDVQNQVNNHQNKFNEDYTVFSMEVYKNLQPAQLRSLQPVLRAINNLFILFEDMEDEQWLFN